MELRNTDLDVLRDPTELELRHGLFWLAVRHGRALSLRLGRLLYAIGISNGWKEISAHCVDGRAAADRKDG